MSLLPALVPIRNPDKEYHESWGEHDNLLDFPHPFRAVFLGPPGCGKTTAVKNLVMRQDPPFERMYMVHADGMHSQEYNDLEAVHLSRIPQPEEWPGLSKTLCVLDDLELKTLKSKDKKALDRLFGYSSTHLNISVVLCSQDPFNVPPIVRRCANVWALWPGTDPASTAQCAKRCGQDLKELFQYCRGPKNSVWIDLTDDSPARLRLDGFFPISQKETKNRPDPAAFLPARHGVADEAGKKKGTPVLETAGRL